MSSAWKLDRKVVKIALQLAEIISEKHRLLIQDISIRIFKRFHDILSTASQFLGKKANLFYGPFNTMRPMETQTCRGVSKTSNIMAHRAIYTVTTLSDSQRIERLTRWGLPSDHPIFGYFGKLSQEKRPLGFLKLAYWMQMFKDNSLFVMIGDGVLQDEVQTTATKYGLSNFRWMSSIENPEEFYPILSGLVITSASEQSGPTVMFQALAYGIPVFSTDVGKAKRVLEQYGSGLVIKHDPEEKDFADCFKLWKDNLEIYEAAAIETADLIRGNLQVESRRDHIVQ